MAFKVRMVTYLCFTNVPLVSYHTNPSMQSSTRKVYLISYDSPFFPAHWIMFIPSASDPVIGTGIHVTGDAAGGFEHEFKRNYDHKESKRTHAVIPLGDVASGYIADLTQPLR
ncbi:hypothetical protein FRC11_003739, partial [Ceratobasidium sp. 423]